MGLFKRKEYTDEQNREFLEESGVPVAKGYNRKSKFSAYSQHADRVASGRSGAPQDSNPPAAAGNNAAANPYANAQLSYNGGGSSSKGFTAYGKNETAYGGVRGGGADPYARGGAPGAGASAGYGGASYGGDNTASRYGDANSSPYGADPYSNTGSSSSSSSDRYGGNSRDNYSQPASSGYSPYAQAQSGYASRFGQNPLERTETNATDRAELFKGVDRSRRAGAAAAAVSSSQGGSARGSPAPDAKNISAADELMEMPSELNEGYQPESEQQQTYVDSEDEEVETIKGQIKSVRGDTVQSTRNILDIAARAEESGRNTLGMLGSQAERLASTEQNLALTEIQNNIAAEKAKELKRINRSIFVPNISFNSKKKMQQQEDKIRQATEIEQHNRDARRQIQYESEQRVTQALTSKSNEIAQRYRQQARDKKYMFEEDSEDEAQEDEINGNMVEVAAASGRLKQLALATRDELDDQLGRLERIGDMADQQEIKTHINIHRLANVK